ncbi:MAG: DUF2442 domain-containing protein [Polyangiaceae bacterium]|nr:DUF2442 domain-containing protein [Polyangiaceae bacterium]
MVRIRSVEPVRAFVVRLAFTDGSHAELDLEAVMQGPVFDAIRADAALFREVFVEPQLCGRGLKRVGRPRPEQGRSAKARRLLVAPHGSAGHPSIRGWNRSSRTELSSSWYASCAANCAARVSRMRSASSG